MLQTRINSKGEAVPFLEQSVWPTAFGGAPKIFLAILFSIIGFMLIFILEFVANKFKKA